MAYAKRLQWLPPAHRGGRVWPSSRFPTLVVLSLFCVCALTVLASDETDERQLETDYKGKVLTQRHFYGGEHLRFGSDGRLIGEAEIGPWTIDAQLLVTSIRLRGRILDIEARRIFMFFDPDTKQFSDISVVRKGSETAKLFTSLRDRGSPQQLAQQEHLHIEMEMVSENPDAKEIRSAMEAIFLSPGESLADLVPSFWCVYFDRQGGRIENEPALDESVYSPKEGEVSIPRALHTADPEYPEAARHAGYQGSVTLSLVVGVDGMPTNISITKPAGFGLDEKAVEALSTWRFEPGRKEGRPVPVKISAEMSFGLY